MIELTGLYSVFTKPIISYHSCQIKPKWVPIKTNLRSLNQIVLNIDLKKSQGAPRLVSISPNV